MKIGKIIMLSVIGAAAMVGCSEDELGNDKKEYGTLEPVVGTFPGDEIALSRAGENPEWWMYEELYPLSLENEPTIGIFMTQGNAPMMAISGKFVYKLDETTVANPNPKARWSSDIAVEDGTMYNIFGYMSANNSSWIASIEPNGISYANGAIMKLKNLDVVTASDVSAVVGVLKGDMNDSGNTPKMRETVQNEGKDYGTSSKESYIGSYSFLGEANKNFIYLWLDHLYACVNFELMVDDEYSKLRVIKLKQVDLGVSNTSEKYDVTVTLGTNSAEPITDVKYEEPSTPGSATATLYKSTGEGTTIPKVSESKYLNIPGYFAPAESFTDESQTMTVTFTYDLYTVKSNGELILEKSSRVAKNTINIGELLQGKKLERGTLYTVRAKIQPTYLYVLADEDLDNPTFELEIGD